jgi:hypothetical protein
LEFVHVEGFETTFLSWQAAASRLDARVRPIATRSVDISDPAWVDEARRQVNPLDEAGVRDDAARLISGIFDAYPRVTADERDRIRGLFAAHRSLAWAAGFLLPFSADAVTLRPQLLLFSILDQGSDSRDAIALVARLLRAGARRPRGAAVRVARDCNAVQRRRSLWDGLDAGDASPRV